MKKGSVARSLALGLVLACLLGLCACGGGSEANPDLAKENVYRLKEIEMPELYEPGNGYMSVMGSASDGVKVQLLVNVTDWNNYNEYDYRVISMNTDGSDVKMISLEFPDVDTGNQGNAGMMPAPVEEEGTPVDDGAEDGQDNNGTEPGEDAAAPEDNVIEPRDNEPTSEPGEDDAAPEDNAAAPDTDTAEPGEDSAVPDTDTAVPVPMPMPGEDTYNPNIWERTWYSSFLMTADGIVYAQKTHSIEDSTDPENYVSKSESSVCGWDAEGKYLWDVSLGEMGDRTGVNNMLVGADGAIYLILSESNEDYTASDFYKVRIGVDGSVGERQKLSDEAVKVFSNMEQVVPKTDGTIFMVYRDEKDWTKKYYTSYDVAADKMGETKDFPGSISYTYDYNVMIPGLSHDLIYTGNGGIYCWDQGKEEGQVMVDFINSDLYIERLINLVELDKDSFLGFFQEDWNSGIKAGIFTYVKPEDIQDKKVLVLAGNYVSSDLKKRVIEYNRNNADYRIVIKEYNTYNSYDDQSAAVTRLNSDIVSGNMPDILVNPGYNSLPVENYISKGLLADIGRLIEEDEELSQVEFMENAFDAYRVNGKLYSIVPDFEVYTMIAKKSLVGDRESWTMADMQQVVESMGPETKAFSGETTQNGFINMVMRYCGNQFVDLSTGKCSFNTDDFISMLEYAKALPTDDTESSGYDEDYWNDYWTNYESQYRQNRTLMLEANFWRFDNLTYTINGRIGEAVSYTGFPTESGNGSYIMSSQTYVLSSRSKNLDEAWNFMRYYLTEEAQENASYFPVQKSIFLEKSKAAMERPSYEWTDENGEVHVEYEDMSIWINGESVPYDPLSQEQLDELIAFVESVHNPYYYNEEIMKIIDEETGGYFSGQKPAADVADVIQRRVQNYVDER